MEVNPADVAGVRIRYQLGTAEVSITLSALYQLLLLNPQRGCSILSGFRERARSRHLTDTWAANTPCWASLGELGWEGCADEEIVLFSCVLSHPSLRSLRNASPTNPPPSPATRETPPPCPPPPQSHPTQKATHAEAQNL